MEAFVKTGEGPGEAGLRDVPVPDPGPGEVLLRVASCGICGTDLHAVGAEPGYEWVRPPVVLGHEFSGTVERLGPDVAAVEPGDRAAVLSTQGCRRCPSCLSGSTHLCPRVRIAGLSHDGGMAEYAVVAERHLVPVPEALDLATAALAEPLSIAAHAALSRASIQPGHRVVVSGPGPIGILCGSLAALSGAEVLVAGVGADAPARLPAAEQLGLKTANLAEGTLKDHLHDSFGGRAPDVWIEASGAAEALQGALEAVQRGGVIVVVGMFSGQLSLSPEALNTAVRAELGLLFSYASSYADYQVSLDLLSRGAIDPEPLIRSYPLKAAAEALEAASSGETVKPVLLP